MNSLNSVAKENLLLFIKSIRLYFFPLILIFSYALYKSATRQLSLQTPEMIYLIIYNLLVSHFIFGINDYYDFKEDKKNSRKKGLVNSILFGNGGLKKKERLWLKNQLLLSSTLLILLTLMRKNIYHSLFTIALLISTYIYSRFRLKEKIFLFELTTYLSILFYTAALYLLWSGTFPKIFYFLALIGVQGNYLGAIVDYKVENNVVRKYNLESFFIVNTILYLVIVVLGNPQTFLLKIIETLVYISTIILFMLKEKEKVVKKIIKASLALGFIILIYAGIIWKP